jgi:hypothetical protein
MEKRATARTSAMGKVLASGLGQALAWAIVKVSVSPSESAWVSAVDGKAEHL